MERLLRISTVLATALLAVLSAVSGVCADGDITKVHHVVIITQAGHSFDNYLGTLPYISATPYHPGPCQPNDHQCVDGLTCKAGSELQCSNSNVADDGEITLSFHQKAYCTPELDQTWPGSHLEGNFTFPNMMLWSSPNDGFVRQNSTAVKSDGRRGQNLNPSMGFYTATELPFYYGLAQTYALDDRYFSSVAGPGFPNRAYQMAATSFGHVADSELFPPAGGYKPMGGSIFDLLDRKQISWTNYFANFPSSTIFRGPTDSHLKHTAAFVADAESGKLPAVSIVDPAFTLNKAGNDEGAPSDVRAGESYVARLVAAVRNGPEWKDSIVFITYDTHGGFYDHVPPPKAAQNGLSSPDGVDPGLCEDLSDPPMSMMPAAGANCFGPPLTEHSFSDAQALCPMLVQPGEAYPSFCAQFNQLGFRVPLIAVSPFSKPHYVSHTIGDHTSLLALIEQRFLRRAGQRQYLTARDQNASTLTDMFDFDHSPSLAAAIPTVPAANPADTGCTG
jgi:phospholipase C